MLGAEVGRHVGLHEVQLHVGPHHEVESHHLEEGALVRVSVEGRHKVLLQLQEKPFLVKSSLVYPQA